MFTGIIEAIGRVKSIDAIGSDSRFVFDTGFMDMNDMSVGDSIAVNGVCLTIIEKKTNQFIADLSGETLALTTFSGIDVGQRINLEKAMQLSDRINGHMINGHIDGVGTVIEKLKEGRSIQFVISTQKDLIGFISKKGSITVDGVSLTVNAVDELKFSINIIPHTLTETIFSDYQIGTAVNLEVDMIARYLARLISRE